ncbi:MAG: glutathione S-transferase family protein [Proteobacteria bacterium]|nr:glutathione S-transferase family protein [Pseudomonadota bacterium]
MTLKLYNSAFAPSPRRVRMYAAEKGIALELIEVNIAEGATRSADFLSVNSLGETPVLEREDGSRVTESLAICRWLEELNPEPNLFGDDAEERLAINRYIDRVMFRLYVPTTEVFRHTHEFWIGRIEQVPAFGELQRKTVRAEYVALDTALADREFLARDRFSMADIVAFTSIDFGKVAGLRVGDDRPALKRWYEAIRARPSARA